MILEYGLRNFLSFKEGATLSFRLQGNVPDSISQGNDFSTVMLVKGANASGKTHLLKALAFLAFFISRSFSSDIKDSIAVEPFGNSKDFSSFFVDFRIGEDEYRYELDAEPKQVLREVLYRTRKRKVKLVERVKDVVLYAVNEFADLKKIKLRKNASFISTAAQHEMKGVLSIVDLFEDVRFNVTSTGFKDGGFLDLDGVCQFLYEDPEALSGVVGILDACDTGVSDIKIIEEPNADGSGKRYFPLFLHRSGAEDIWVKLATESSGTKQLFRHMLGHVVTIRSGGLLILDEFDLYLHPHLLKIILDLYTDPMTNPHGAQLLFTSHQDSVMDICGRYRTYLVSKEDNVSFAYRLDELPGDILRNDRPIVPYYNDGRIGGVPKL